MFEEVEEDKCIWNKADSPFKIITKKPVTAGEKR